MTTAISRPPALPRPYLVWLGGATVSQLGDSVLYFALGWAASALGGPTAALILTASIVPRLVLLLLGGTVADRAGARRVMITSDAAMTALTVALGLAVARLGTPLWVLVATSLLMGVVSAFYLPSLGSMPRRLVPDAALPRALALRQGLSQVVTMAGAPLGGLLLAATSLPTVAWIDAMTFAFVLVVLIAIRPALDGPAHEQGGRDPVREPVIRAALDGLRVAARTPGLGPALLLVAGVAAFALPPVSLLIPLLGRESGWGAGLTGLVAGANGLGTVLAALVVARRGAASRPGISAAAGVAVTAVGIVLVALAPGLVMPASGGLGPLAWTSIGSAVLGGAVMGTGTGTFVANLSPVLLGSTPRTHLARVQAVLGLVQLAPVLVANTVLGAIAESASPVVALAACAAGLLACAAQALRSPQLRGLGIPS